MRNPSEVGSITAKDSTSVSSCDASVRPGVKGTSMSCPASLAAFSTAAHPPRTIRSARETCLPPVWDSLKDRWTSSRTLRTRRSSSGWLTSQLFIGSSRMRAPLAPPRMSDPRYDAADDHAVNTSWDTDRPESRILALSAAMSPASMSSYVRSGIGSCHTSVSLGTSGPR